jgi:hypothetical protein
LIGGRFGEAAGIVCGLEISTEALVFRFVKRHV